ncbi:hypothetical protein ff3pr_01897 [Weissella cibaria]|nr:hypothetical protein ff3pr_01897 [Weissella cibaria]
MNNDQITSFYNNNGFGRIDLANGREIRSLPSFSQFGLMTLRIFNLESQPAHNRSARQSALNRE